MTSQEKLISWAKAQIGYEEGYNNHNKYATGRYEAYGWDVQNQPWCDVFVDVCFIECFGLDVASKMTYQPKGNFSALCRESARLYKENGAWREKPEPGDQIFFYSGGAINHTGIVEKIVNGAVYTIEGNSSDGVRQGVYSTASSFIAGYGRPKWSVVSDNTEPSAPDPHEDVFTISAKVPLLSRGEVSSWVKICQLRMMALGQKLPKWGADGDFGAETQRAVENFQKEQGLVITSTVDEPTWAKLLGE